jgi:hypothetical protein
MFDKSRLDGKNKRLVVIEKSVEAEHIVTKILARQLNIDLSKSESLSSKSSGLSFHSKLSLLLDTELLKPEDRVKLQKFSEIRNKFAHVLEVDNFEMCVKLVDGLKNHLEKYFQDDDKFDDNEERFYIAYFKLSDDVFKILRDIETTITVNAFQNGFQEVTSFANHSFARYILSLPSGTQIDRDHLIETLTTLITEKFFEMTNNPDFKLKKKN